MAQHSHYYLIFFSCILRCPEMGNTSTVLQVEKSYPAYTSTVTTVLLVEKSYQSYPAYLGNLTGNRMLDSEGFSKHCLISRAEARCQRDSWREVKLHPVDSRTGHLLYRYLSHVRM